jgi:glutamyl-tRNA synthetase
VGWSYDDKTEFFTRGELIRYFDLSKVSVAPAAFSYDKLDYMNAAYIRQLGHNDLAGRLYPVLRAAGLNADPDMTLKLVPLIRERIKTLQEAAPAVDFFFQPELQYDAQRLIQKGMDAPRGRAALEAAATRLEGLAPFEEAALEPPLRALSDELGIKVRDLFGAMRVACTGREVSPPLFGTLAILGKDVVVRRLREAAGRL